MKRNISDLLDQLPAEDVEIQTATPLSGLRIKRKVMSRIGRKRRPCWLGRVAVIAAVVTALTVTAFAVDTILNDGAMFASIADTLNGNQPTTTVSNDGVIADDTLAQTQPTTPPNEDSGPKEPIKVTKPLFCGTQEELIADMERDFDVVVESNGATITPIRAIADEENYHLYLRVEAPEGVVLPDLTEGFYYDFGYRGRDEYAMDIRYKHLENNFIYPDIHYVSYYWDDLFFRDSTYPLEDADPTDNVKEFVIRFTDCGDPTVFNGSEEKWLQIRCLSIVKQHSADNSEDQVLFRGDFNFEITNANENRRDQSLVIKTGGLSFYNEEFGYTTTVNKITIRPLSIELDCTYTTPNEKYIFPYGGPLQLVMKDGRTIDVLDAYDDCRDLSYREYIHSVWSGKRFWEPIVVGEIDYLLFNGEHIIDVN